MASGAKLVEDWGLNALNLKCNDARQILKGDLLYLSDAGKVYPSTDVDGFLSASGLSGAFIGIAAMDKEANDGSTTISVRRKGTFDIWSASGAVFSAGDLVGLSGANSVAGLGISGAYRFLQSGALVGKALESVNGTPEQVEVLVGEM